MIDKIGKYEKGDKMINFNFDVLVTLGSTLTFNNLYIDDFGKI